MVTPFPRPRAELDDELRTAMEAEANRHFALARRLLGDDADAADALQEAWLRAWRGRDAWRGEGPAGAWLRAIVARECLRTLRWRGVRRWLPFGERVPDHADPVAAPDGALDAARARLAVAALPTQQRIVFTLRFDEGWTIPEIAVALELSGETVKTHLTRALDRLRGVLGAPDVL